MTIGASVLMYERESKVLIKLINLTIAVPMHAFLSTPNDLRNSSFLIFENI